MEKEHLRKLFLALIIIYFLRAGYHFSGILELTRVGAISALYFLAYLIGNLCLFIGSLRYVFMKKGKGKLFLIALIALGSSLSSLFPIPSYSSLSELLYMSPPSLTVFGILFSIGGWWLCRDNKRSNPSFKQDS